MISFFFSCSQTLINLMLTGHSVSNVWDSTRVLSGLGRYSNYKNRESVLQLTLKCYLAKTREKGLPCFCFVLFFTKIFSQLPFSTLVLARLFFQYSREPP